MEYHQALAFARVNRRNQTPAEECFWNNVRARRFLGLKINRQFVIEYSLYGKGKSFFIADFYCHQLNLIIEIYGRVHNYQKEYDQHRTEILQGLDMSIVRFSNKEVLSNWSYVARILKDFVVNKSSEHP